MVSLSTTTTTTTSAAQPTDTSSSNDAGYLGLGIGVIVGATLLVVFILVAIGFGVWWCLRRRRAHRRAEYGTVVSENFRTPPPARNRVEAWNHSQNTSVLAPAPIRTNYSRQRIEDTIELHDHGRRELRGDGHHIEDTIKLHDHERRELQGDGHRSEDTIKLHDHEIRELQGDDYQQGPLRTTGLPNASHSR